MYWESQQVDSVNETIQLMQSQKGLCSYIETEINEYSK